MTASPNPDGFEETTALPAGRKAREVSEGLLRTLADSAKRSVAFAKTAAPDVIEDLRKDLGSAAVRAKYTITQGTEKLSDTQHKLTFSAVAKDEATTTAADATAAGAEKPAK